MLLNLPEKKPLINPDPQTAVRRTIFEHTGFVIIRACRAREARHCEASLLYTHKFQEEWAGALCHTLGHTAKTRVHQEVVGGG